MQLQGWGANPTPRRHPRKEDGKPPDGAGLLDAVLNDNEHHEDYWGAGYGGLLLTGSDLRGNSKVGFAYAGWDFSCLMGALETAVEDVTDSTWETDTEPDYLYQGEVRIGTCQSLICQ